MHTDNALIRAYVTDLTSRRLAPATIRVRTTVARELIGGYGPHLTGPDLLQVEQVHWSHLSKQSHASYVQHAGDLCAWLIRTGQRADNPAAVLTRPRVPKRRPRPMPEDDVKMALACAPPLERCWVALGGWAGLRCMELASLDAADVSLDGEPYVRVTGKGDRERIVPVGPLLVRELVRWRVPRSGPVFRHATSGAPWSAAQVSTRLNGYLHGLGIPSTAHSLRHRWATMLVQSGCDLVTVQALMGHESAQTTLGYTDWSRPHAREHVLRLDGTLAVCASTAA